MGIRFFIIIGFFGLFYAGLGYKLYFLQIVQSDAYAERTEATQERNKLLELRRGQIFFTDRNEEKISVALNRNYPIIFASPKEMNGEFSTSAKVVGQILNQDVKEVETNWKKNSESMFAVLLEKPTQDQINAIKAAKLKGIHIREKQYRTYPFGKLGSQVVGFLGVNADHPDPYGLYGIEKLKNTQLSEGNDINLTLDRNIQIHAEQVLAKLVEKHQATGGTILVTEPQTGKILAMANSPDFDANKYKEYPVKNFRNPAVQDQYEPGSVFKPLTMAAGIDAGAFTPETTFVDTGKITLNTKTITNWDKKAYGKITMTNVIEHSVNTGAVFAEQKMGNKTFYEYLKKFGFGEITKIDLPDEAFGSLKNLENKNARAIDFATASYGQGTSVTPVQLAAAFGALANKGVLMRPYVSRDFGSSVVRRVISEETAAKIVKMMESAVEVNKIAAIPGYRIAGKTGTAFVPDFVNGGYTDDQFIHTFIGFGPVSNPKFLILMKLDKPQIGQLAGSTIVPVFRDIAEFVLNYYSIAPDTIEGIATSTSKTP